MCARHRKPGWSEKTAGLSREVDAVMRTRDGLGRSEEATIND